MRLPDANQEFVLEIEVGELGYGGVLLQAASDGHLWPIGCVSKLKRGEQWQAGEGVLRTTLYCVRKFRSLLEFCPRVEVRTTVPGV